MLKKRVLLFSLLSWMLAFPIKSQYKTQVFSSEIRSLELHRSDAWDAPEVIRFQSEEQIRIAFDRFSHDYHRFAYRLVYCHADWTPSSLSEIEYMEGFTENNFDEGTLSQATMVEYTHHELLLPNDDVRLKLSGNYAVEIFDQDEPEKVLVRACFSVLDRRMGIEAKVSASTDLGYNQHYQQVAFVLNCAGFDRPRECLYVCVQQNRRTDNQVLNPTPYMASSSVMDYQHCESLIFEAGNEYRRCELTSFKVAGLGVDRIRYESPYYHAYLFDGEPRVSGYSYDRDQNGRFLIRSLQSFEDSRYEADYFMVHFRYPMPKLPLNESLYLMGDFNREGEWGRYQLHYNEQTQSYECSMLLKQGAYNYLYALADTHSPTRFKLDRTEGNHWATENEYRIFVYYRPLGGEYDALVGYTEIVCRP